MRKFTALYMALLLALSLSQAYSEESPQYTYRIGNMLEYTVYDAGSFSLGKNNTQYFYPDAGGLFMVQVSDFDRMGFGYTKELVYEILFPGLISAVKDASQNPSLYYERRFVCGGYYGLHIKMTHIISEQSLNTSSYYVLLPDKVVTIHFVDTLELGAYPQENIPYTLMSLRFL